MGLSRVPSNLQSCLLQYFRVHVRDATNKRPQSSPLAVRRALQFFGRGLQRVQMVWFDSRQMTPSTLGRLHTSGDQNETKVEYLVVVPMQSAPSHQPALGRDPTRCTCRQIQRDSTDSPTRSRQGSQFSPLAPLLSLQSAR